jgi:hypothetical protein
LIGYGGCAACHVLFKLIKTLSLSESDAGRLAISSIVRRSTVK